MSTAPITHAGPTITNPSILLYGRSKTGKTENALKLPGVLGFDLNDGFKFTNAQFDKFVAGTHFKDLDGMSNLVKHWAGQIKRGNAAYKTMLFDDLTAYVTHEAKTSRGNKLVVYGRITDTVSEMVRAAMDAGCIVVATGHRRSTITLETDELMKVEVGPKLNPALAEELVELFDMVLYVDATPSGAQIVTVPTTITQPHKVSAQQTRMVEYTIIAGHRGGYLPARMALDMNAITRAMTAYYKANRRRHDATSEDAA